jgi:hypothetical protein
METKATAEKQIERAKNESDAFNRYGSEFCEKQFTYTSTREFYDRDLNIVGISPVLMK